MRMLDLMTVEDFRSETWRRFMACVEAEIADLREQNDQPSLDERKTASLRGRIANMKELLEHKPSTDADPLDEGAR